jgi:sensor domain CHASE-containing protein
LAGWSFRSTTTRLLAVLVVTGAVFAAVIFFSYENQRRLLDNHAALEQKKSQDEVTKLIDLMGAKLASFADDYSRWDELAQSVIKKDRKWAEINIWPALTTFSANVFWVLDSTAVCCYAFDNMDDSLASSLPLTNVERKEIAGSIAFRHFCVPTRWGWLEIRLAPIQPTADTLRQAPALGYFIVGKLWTAEHLRQLSKLTGTTLSIVLTKDALGNHLAGASGTETVVSQVPLSGLDEGAAAFVVSTKVSDELQLLSDAAYRQIKIIGALLPIVFFVLAAGFAILFINSKNWCARSPTGCTRRRR